MPLLVQQHPQQRSAAVVPVPATPFAAPVASSPLSPGTVAPSLPAEHLQELTRQLAKSAGAAEAYLQTLDREEAALLLCEVLCRAGRRQRITRAVAAVVIFCCFAFAVRTIRLQLVFMIVGPVTVFARGAFTALLAPPAGSRRAAEILAREAQPALTNARHAGPLVDTFAALESMRRRELQGSRARIIAALSRLLPRLTASEAEATLTPQRRAVLRHALKHALRNRDAYPDDFTVAALLALGTAQDERTMIPAMRLRSSPSERIQAAAEECLRALNIIS